MISCVLIEDDLYWNKQTAVYISQISGLILTNNYLCGKTALKEITKLNEPVDFLFIAADMHSCSGLELGKMIRAKAKYIILMSRRASDAVESYEIDTSQFLLKPFDFKKFELILGKLIVLFNHTNACIFVNLSKKKQAKLCLHNIIAIEAAGNYVRLHLTDRKMLVYSSLKDINTQLIMFTDFKKVSRSFIVSKKHIEGTDLHKIYLRNNLSVTIGHTYKKDILENFEDWMKS